MNGILCLFLYTPLPWVAIIYVVAYRHNLTRFARPFKDCDDLRTWWSVCSYLGLVESGTRRPARKVWKNKVLLAFLAITLASVLGPQILAPLGWYYLVVCQAASALGLFLVLVSRIGPIPSQPYADTLRYPRLGTRARHLGNERKARRNPFATHVEGGARR